MEQEGVRQVTRHKSPWTTNEDAELVRAAQDHEALADVALRLGRTLHAVEHRSDRLDLGRLKGVYTGGPARSGPKRLWPFPDATGDDQEETEKVRRQAARRGYYE